MDSSLLIARILYIAMWIVLIIMIAVLISTIISFFKIDVSEYVVESEKIPDSFNNFKILQLSDLHNASLGKDNKRLLKKIEEVKPNIIVMTGDMVSSNSKNFNTFFNLAKEVAEKYDTYYIMGNHEMRLTGKQQLEIMMKLTSFGIKLLDNKQDLIVKNSDHISIYGLDQPISTYKNIFKNNAHSAFTLDDMNNIFPSADNTAFNLLLTHSPISFDVFSNWGADLTLTGHIHGGLVRLPFIGGLLSPERTLFPKYDAGEYDIDDSKMVVSRGLGNGTINIRVFNNPEISVITLKSSN